MGGLPRRLGALDAVLLVFGLQVIDLSICKFHIQDSRHIVDNIKRINALNGLNLSSE